MSTSARSKKGDTVEAKMKRLETERDKVKAKSEGELELLKTVYEKALARTKLELDSLKSENESQQSTLTFLKVCRDCVKGDITLSDIESEVGQGIMAHRIILASKSEVFRDRFETQMLGKPKVHLRMRGASLPVIEAIVNFCYTGEISFTESVPPEEVLKIAQKYEIEHLWDVCEAELCGSITIDNVLQLLELSRKLGARTLHAEARTFAKEHREHLEDLVLQAELEDLEDICVLPPLTAPVSTLESSGSVG